MPFPTKDFPSTSDLKRVQQEHEYFKFYDSDVLDPEGTTDRAKFRLREFFENDSKKAKILDIALNIAPVIIDSATDFTFGRLPTVQVEEGFSGSEEIQGKIDQIVTRNKLMQRMRDSSALFQAVGHAQFKIYVKDDQAYVNELPYHYYFPNWDGVPVDQETNNPRIVCYLDKTEGLAVTKYIFIEDYYLDPARGGKLTIAQSLWTDMGARIGTQVSFTSFPSIVVKWTPFFGPRGGIA